MSSGFWDANMPAVNFAYALAFFTLGVGIALQGRLWQTRFTLARSLPALAAFAIVHAAADWGAVFIPLYYGSAAERLVPLLVGLKTVATALSFGFLLRFGILLVSGEHPPERRTTGVPVAVVAVWIVFFLAYPLIRPGVELHSWFAAAEVWSRYLLGFPAAALAAVGLSRQGGEIGRLDRGRWLPYLRGASLSFAAYALAGGLVVPRQAFFPASVMNEESFLAVFGFPVKLVRGAAGLGVAFCMLRLLEIFRWEVEARLRRAEEERAVLCERTRIARELHDGIMQTLYGAGLALRQVGVVLDDLGGGPAGPDDARRDESLAGARTLVREAADALSAAVTELRGYVQGLRTGVTSLTWNELAAEIGALVRQVSCLTGLVVDLEFDGLEPASSGSGATEPPVPRALRDDVIALLREALSNVVRHSGSRRARVVVARSEATLLVRVSDDGRGFVAGSASQGQGLDNMRQRVEARGGVWQVHSAPGEGAQVVAYLPLGEFEAGDLGGMRRGTELHTAAG
ncbi:sensor histidine kinase [Caldinitratiruptor microaerophilus]|uniref:Oxygen sensor histidine kinase NreB n=1 Tax=Caldinitratiruptor microaerophilus TaxID=671077 RepID=A0AA35CMP1_9FIRM|nr:ATP-binding protein [Caldinitratiruptor microaerophilus]BDG61299.1 two-component sensor histidine kinase [Caldinitratiruptor microaerophilus]